MDHFDGRGSLCEKRHEPLDTWRSSSRNSQLLPDLRHSLSNSPKVGSVTTGDITSETCTKSDSVSRTSEQSIYGHEREHCYQNVQKDETGRLLNRDTVAFGAAILDSDDEPPKFNVDVTSPNHNPSSMTNYHTYSSPKKNDQLVVGIQRTSRSVDNIAKNEASGTVEKNKVSSHYDSTVANVPYHTGRSTFYQRVHPESGC